jgi:pyruvate/2-oxoglutarate dehydrogenase complex dihydrolipoamide dehydrogenase (E3) component
VDRRDQEGRRQTLTTRSIVIATGAMPFVPPLPGLEEVGYLTSDTLWGLRELPPRLVVLGGGPIGCELAQSFARLGSQVTQIEMAPRIMIREDEEVSALAKAALEHDGVAVITGHKALRCERVDGRKFIVVEAGGAEKRFEFDQLLCAVGRVARLKGYGLEELGIAAGRTIETNEYLQTAYPNILAAGDVAGPYQFTHVAAHQAWYASVNALFGQFKKFKADYSVIPWATFIDPEVARVGLNEQEAKERGIAVEVTRYGIDDLDRAIADSAAHGFVKVLTERQDRIPVSPSSARMPATCSPNTCWRCATAWAEQDPRHHPHLPTMAEEQVRGGEWKRNTSAKLLEWWSTTHGAGLDAVTASSVAGLA